MFYVYILTNKINTVLYIGITNNLSRRLYEHQHDLIDGFTKKISRSQTYILRSLPRSFDCNRTRKAIKGLEKRKKEYANSKNESKLG